MSNRILFVIDVQNGFIGENTAHIPGLIKELILGRKFVNRPGSFLETHMNWKEMYTSPETDIVPELSRLAKNVFIKHAYTAFTSEVKNFLERERITDIYITGLETEICVLKTALDALEIGYRPVVLSKYCGTKAHLTFHESAIEILKRDIGEQNVY